MPQYILAALRVTRGGSGLFPDRDEPDRTAFDRGRNPIFERRPIALHEDVDAGPFLAHADPGPHDAGQVHPGRRPPRQHLLDHGPPARIRRTSPGRF